MMVNGMNGGHAKMADWGMSHLKTIAPEQIVEIGCGGGKNAGELLKKYPSAHVTAIDYYSSAGALHLPIPETLTFPTFSVMTVTIYN